MSSSFLKKFRQSKKDYSVYFALAVFLFIGIVTFTSSRAPTGYSIADTSYSINAIALEEGADADVIIAASDFASDHYITETMLTSESTGAEQNTLFVQNLGAATTTITQSGTNLVLEGDAQEGFAALNAMESTNYELFSTYDAVQVVNGQVVGVTPVSSEQVSLEQPLQPIEEQQPAPTNQGPLCSEIPYNSLSVSRGTVTVHFSNYGLYLCDGSTTYSVVVEEKESNMPVLSDTHLVYFKNYGIYLYDLATAEKTQLSTDSSNYPTINGDWVAYFKNYGIYVYSISAQETFEIEPANSGCGWQPSISGNTLYYKCNYQDRTYDLSTLEITAVPHNNCVDSDGGDNPAVYGTLKGTDVWGNVIDQTDQCGSGTATVNDVFEKVCTEESYTYTQHTCEYGCLDGACLSPVSYEPVCGNGVIEDAETCDDGNIENGDGCTADCTAEVKEGCWETDNGVAGTYSGYYYGYYGDDQEEYSYDYSYDNYCYYDSYGGVYYYADYYCSQSTSDNKWYPSSTWQTCSSGCEDTKGCVETATVTPSCVDTDNGKDQHVYGETTLINKFGEEKKAVDTCYSYSDDYQYVVENYCYAWDNNNYLYTEYVQCEGVCKEGVCVDAAYTPTCADSDGTAMYEYDWQKSASTFGTVTGNDKSGNSIEKSDYCYDSYGYEYVVEQYCSDKNARYENYVYCPGGCENGVCVKPTWEQSCTDSDATTTNAGRDVYTAGTASGIDYYGKEFTYADYCYYSSWDNTNYVVDYYCAESSYSGAYASSYWDKCTDGCENGACVGEQTTLPPVCTVGDKTVTGTDAYGSPYTYYDYCNGAEALVTYGCGADSVPVATETPCNCVDSQCHTASMTVAQFMSSASNPVIVIGASAATQDNIAAIDLAGKYGWKVVTDATISDPTTGTYVAIGGPYANKVSEAAFGGQTWDYGVGEALFLVKEHDAGGKTLVVSGSEAQDTRNAVSLLIENPSSLNEAYVVQRVG